MAHVLNVANLWLLGMIVGQEFSTAVAVNPAARALPVPCEVRFQQELARRYKGLGPLLFFSSFGTAIAVAATIDSDGRPYAIAGTILVAAMIVTTFSGNMPVNLWTFEQGENVEPETWRHRRRRWDAFHTVRVVLDAAAFACFFAALLAVV